MNRLKMKLSDAQLAPLSTKDGAAAVKVVQRLQNFAHEAFIVGGAVRDMVMGVEPKDFDVVTSATPDEVKGVFDHVLEVGAAFAITPVVIDEAVVEVATYRTESNYTDSRRPDVVELTRNIYEDVKRRDFTINGLFLDPQTGEVTDLVGGIEDLGTFQVRAIGNPKERFEEDALRMLRAIRFAGVLGFSLDVRTKLAITELAPTINNISNERIREELCRMLVGGGAAWSLMMLHETGLLSEILPEVAALRGVEQPKEFHPEGDVFTHVHLMLEHFDRTEERSLNVGMAILLHDIGKPSTQALDEGRIRFIGHEDVGADMAREVMERFRLPIKTTDTVVAMIERHMAMHRGHQMKTKKKRKHFLLPHFAELLELARIDSLSGAGDMTAFNVLSKEFAEFDPSQFVDPIMKGRDLIDMGMEPSPDFGRILGVVREAQLAGTVTTIEEAKNIAKSLAKPEAFVH
jgi:poly(A) polymerase